MVWNSNAQLVGGIPTPKSSIYRWIFHDKKPSILGYPQFRKPHINPLFHRFRKRIIWEPLGPFFPPFRVNRTYRIWRLGVCRHPPKNQWFFSVRVPGAWHGLPYKKMETCDQYDTQPGYDIHSSPWKIDGPNRNRWFMLPIYIIDGFPINVIFQEL